MASAYKPSFLPASELKVLLGMTFITKLHFPWYRNCAGIRLPFFVKYFPLRTPRTCVLKTPFTVVVLLFCARVIPATNHSDLSFCTGKNAVKRHTRRVTLRNLYLPEWDKDTKVAFHLSELSLRFLYMLSVRIKWILLKKTTTPSYEDLQFSSLAPYHGPISKAQTQLYDITLAK